MVRHCGKLRTCPLIPPQMVETTHRDPADRHPGRTRGIALDEAFEDRLAFYGDVNSLEKMLEAADRITDFHAYALEVGIEDPESQP